VTCRVDSGFGIASRSGRARCCSTNSRTDAVATAESLRDDLAMQHRRFEAAALDPLGQIGLEPVEQARPFLGHDHHFLPRRGVGVLGDGSVVPAQMASDLPEPAPCGSISWTKAWRAWRRCAIAPSGSLRRPPRLRRPQRWVARLGSPCAWRPVLGDQAFDRGGEVLPGGGSGRRPAPRRVLRPGPLSV
jgi:hypothetical protein